MKQKMPTKKLVTEIAIIGVGIIAGVQLTLPLWQSGEVSEVHAQLIDESVCEHSITPWLCD